ncbi:MAG TPA: hypothetical protein VF159_03300 [Gemmatimonadaceae bacterium]
MQSRLFDRDEELGLTRIFHYDEADDVFHIETIQDVTDLVEINKALNNDAPDTWRGDLHRVASIPLSLYCELVEKGIIEENDPKQTKLRAWLNDRDNRVFRTRPGRV